MNPITRKITVRGQQIKTRTPRAFAVVAVRPEPIPAADGGVYVPFATVLRRTDSIETARTAARRSSWHTGRGVAVVVVDLATGQEI